MKSKSTNLFLLCIICMISITSCCRKYVDRCNKLTATIAPDTNQIIIRFKEKLADSTIPEYLNYLKDSLQREGYDINYNTCGCDLKLVLFEFDPDMSQEDREKIADEDLEQHGGKIFNNIEILLDSVPAGNLYEMDTTHEGEGIVIAIIDGGIRKNDPELADKIWVNPDDIDDCYTDDINGYDFVYNSGSNEREINPHGTFVSKLIVRNAEEGMKIQLMDLRIFDEHGKGNLFNALCALNYAAHYGARIANMSWGYYQSKKDETNSLFLSYIKEFKESIVIVASAGNDSINTDCCRHFPSGFYKKSYHAGNVISVASLKNNENILAGYSNFGIQTVGIAAKGTFRMVEEEVDIEGTSFAAPLVTARATILISNSTELGSIRLVECLKEHAEPLNPPQRIDKGKLNETITRCD